MNSYDNFTVSMFRKLHCDGLQIVFWQSLDQAIENLQTNVKMKLMPPGIWQDAGTGRACTDWVPEKYAIGVGRPEQADGFKNAQGASVAPEKRSQKLFISGGVLDTDRIETVLRLKFSKMHEIEKRTG